MQGKSSVHSLIEEIKRQIREDNSASLPVQFQCATFVELSDMNLAAKKTIKVDAHFTGSQFSQSFYKNITKIYHPIQKEA